MVTNDLLLSLKLKPLYFYAPAPFKQIYNATKWEDKKEKSGIPFFKHVQNPNVVWKLTKKSRTWPSCLAAAHILDIISSANG